MDVQLQELEIAQNDIVAPAQSKQQRKKKKREDKDTELSKKDYASFLIAERKRLGLSQAELAKRTNGLVDPKNYGKMELSQMVGSPETMIAVAKALGYTKPGIMLDVYAGFMPTREQIVSKYTDKIESLSESALSVLEAFLDFLIQQDTVNKANNAAAATSTNEVDEEEVPTQSPEQYDTDTQHQELNQAIERVDQINADAKKNPPRKRNLQA